jgi:hypothetical protein
MACFSRADPLALGPVSAPTGSAPGDILFRSFDCFNKAATNSSFRIECQPVTP